MARCSSDSMVSIRTVVAVGTGIWGCCYCDVADGGDRHGYQTGKTDAGDCHFLSLHGNGNSFRLQNTPVAECIGSVADPRDAAYGFRAGGCSLDESQPIKLTIAGYGGGR